MSERVTPIALGQINIVVREMGEVARVLSAARRVNRGNSSAGVAPHHANGATSHALQVEVDGVAFARQWNPALDEQKLGSAPTSFSLLCSRDEVDRVHARVVAEGHPSHVSIELALAAGLACPPPALAPTYRGAGTATRRRRS
jgi:hypothetical protein